MFAKVWQTSQNVKSYIILRSKNVHNFAAAVLRKIHCTNIEVKHPESGGISKHR